MEHIKPSVDKRGVPFCVDECPSYDGKRCSILGHRPGTICEPEVVRLADSARARARAEPRPLNVPEDELLRTKAGIGKNDGPVTGGTHDLAAPAYVPSQRPASTPQERLAELHWIYSECMASVLTCAPGQLPNHVAAWADRWRERFEAYGQRKVDDR